MEQIRMIKRALKKIDQRIPWYTRSYHRHPLVHKYLRTKAERANADLIRKNQDVRILVILHLYYPKSWKEIREYLIYLNHYHWDLVITYPEWREEEYNFDAIRALKPDVRFVPCEDLGYDVAPFIAALKTVDLDQYDVVFKMHSKGAKRKFIYIYRQLFIGRGWFINLFEGALGAAVIDKTIDVIAHEPEYGLACAKNLIVHDPSYKEQVIRHTLAKYGLDAEENYYFIAGTCFAAKPAVLKAFQQMTFAGDDYVRMPSTSGFLSLAHGLERYFTILNSRLGYQIYGNEVCAFRRKIKRPWEALCARYSSVRLLDEPYDIDPKYFFRDLDNSFVTYKKKRVRLGSLRYYNADLRKTVPLDQTMPYRYLMGDKHAYEEYCDYQERHHYPKVSVETFENLKQTILQEGYSEANIILTRAGNTIADGQHRACVLAYLYGLDSEIEVLQIRKLNKRSIKRKIYRSLARFFKPKPVEADAEEQEKDGEAKPA